jgi:hypothetical protein
MLDRQVLYRLSYACSLFRSGYFGEMGLLFAQASLTAILLFYISCWDDRHMPPHLDFFHRDGGSLTNFFALAGLHLWSF